MVDGIISITAIHKKNGGKQDTATVMRNYFQVVGNLRAVGSISKHEN